jgi:hypothetical protein
MWFFMQPRGEVMYKKFGLYAALFFFGAMTNVAAAPMPKPPEAVGPIKLSRGILKPEILNGAKQIGDTPVYFSQVRGGNILLGFFGAVGAVANRALIDNQTAKDADLIGHKEDYSIFNLVQDSLDVSGLPKEQPSDFQLEPFILLQSIKGDEVNASLVYYLIQKVNEKIAWEGKYYFHFNRKFPKNVLESDKSSEFGEYLKKSMPTAVSALSEFVLADFSKAIPDLREIKIKSIFFGSMPFTFAGVLLSNSDGISRVRINGNDGAVKGMFVRGMHIFDNSDAEID